MGYVRCTSHTKRRFRKSSITNNCELKYNKPNLLNPHFIALSNGLSEIMPCGGEIVDTRNLKPSKETSCRFKSGPGHHIIFIRYFYEKFYSCWRRICWTVLAVLVAQKFNVKLLRLIKKK